MYPEVWGDSYAKQYLVCYLLIQLDKNGDSGKNNL